MNLLALLVPQYFHPLENSLDSTTVAKSVGLLVQATAAKKVALLDQATVAKSVGLLVQATAAM